MNLMCEQHDDTVFLFPTIVLSRGECSDDCPEIHWFIGLSFLIWTFSIWK